jgi:hypothetical protein
MSNGALLGQTATARTHGRLTKPLSTTSLERLNRLGKGFVRGFVRGLIRGLVR